jgi:hypothetical protein
MKETKIKASMVPNLLTHSLIALELEPKFLSRINPDYKSKYKDWASKFEKESLEDLKFAIEGVSSNANFAFLYQIPAYLTQDTIQSLRKTLELLSTHTLEQFIEYYPGKKQKLEAYVPKQLISKVWGINNENLTSIQETFPSYTDIIEALYNRYFHKRWMGIEKSLENKKRFLVQNYFIVNDWIGMWEKITEIYFPYSSFQVVLIDALATYGTSILAEKDVFYAHGPTELLVSMISHEIGTHILFNTYTLMNKGVAELVSQGLETYLKGNELLAWSINKQILDDVGVESPKIFSIYYTNIH